MKQLSFFEKLQVLFSNITNHPFFLILLLIPLIILFLRKKHGKKIFVFVYLAVILFILFTFNDVIFELFDNMMDGLFMTLYFPNFITLFVVVVLCSVIALVSFLLKNVKLVNRIINITFFAIVQMLFVLILTTVKANNIDIYADNALYSNNDLLTLMQLLMGSFALQIVSLLIINGIDRVTSMLDGQEKGKSILSRIKKVKIDNNKVGYLNVPTSKKSKKTKLKPFKFDIDKIENVSVKAASEPSINDVSKPNLEVKSITDFKPIDTSVKEDKEVASADVKSITDFKPIISEDVKADTEVTTALSSELKLPKLEDVTSSNDTLEEIKSEDHSISKYTPKTYIPDFDDKKDFEDKPYDNEKPEDKKMSNDDLVVSVNLEGLKKKQRDDNYKSKFIAKVEEKNENIISNKEDHSDNLDNNIYKSKENPVLSFKPTYDSNKSVYKAKDKKDNTTSDYSAVNPEVNKDLLNKTKKDEKTILPYKSKKNNRISKKKNRVRPTKVIKPTEVIGVSAFKVKPYSITDLNIINIQRTLDTVKKYNLKRINLRRYDESPTIEKLYIYDFEKLIKIINKVKLYRKING